MKRLYSSKQISGLKSKGMMSDSFIYFFAVFSMGGCVRDSQIKKLGNTNSKEIFWEVNFLIPVRIPSLNTEDNLLVSAVEYNADVSSMQCNLTLSKKEVYQ